MSNLPLFYPISTTFPVLCNFKPTCWLSSKRESQPFASSQLLCRVQWRNACFFSNIH